MSPIASLNLNILSVLYLFLKTNQQTGSFFSGAQRNLIKEEKGHCDGNIQQSELHSTEQNTPKIKLTTLMKTFTMLGSFIPDENQHYK